MNSNDKLDPVYELPLLQIAYKLGLSAEEVLGVIMNYYFWKRDERFRELMLNDWIYEGFESGNQESPDESP